MSRKSSISATFVAHHAENSRISANHATATSALTRASDGLPHANLGGSAWQGVGSSRAAVTRGCHAEHRGAASLFSKTEAKTLTNVIPLPLVGGQQTPIAEPKTADPNLHT